MGIKLASVVNLPYRALRFGRRLASLRLVPVDHILCGGERGMTGIQYARYSGDVTRTSKPIIESPHCKLLLQYIDIGDEIFRSDIFESTPYFRNACTNLSLFGHYFSATSRDQIKRIAQTFIAEFNGDTHSDHRLPESPKFSLRFWPPLVAPIKHSECFQVQDGNHRLAIAAVRGLRKVRVLAYAPGEVTCLQQLLLDVSWNLNSRLLYQPVNSPEIGRDWPMVRRCGDRLAMMQAFLSAGEGVKVGAASYLDVACNYGWFVSKMAALGYDAHGVEVDSAARQIAISFFGIDPSTFERSEATSFLAATTRQFDVVSCFSLAHHFVRAPDDGFLRLLRLLDKVTGKVLFFEMGDENEAWLRERLKGWNPVTIRTRLKENTSFRSITVLGTDQDRVAPYGDQYGRTLFACVK